MDTVLQVKGNATTFRFLDDAPQEAPASQEPKKPGRGHGRRGH